MFFSVCIVFLTSFLNFFSKVEYIELKNIISKDNEINELTKEKEKIFNLMTKDEIFLKKIVINAGKNLLSESEVLVSEDLFKHIKERKEKEIKAKDRGKRFKNILGVENEIEETNNIEIINN